MILDRTLFGVKNKIIDAIERIKTFEPAEGYYVAFSGGKDSIVVKDLVKRASVKYDIHFNLTTVDPPELIYYIRQYHPDVTIHRPKRTMWQLIVDKRMPPTRIVRWCCSELKEKGGADRLVITGVRWAESVRRSKRRMVERCSKNQTKTYLHPIIDWTDKEVWEYIHQNSLPYCKLYDEGYSRIGCIMCPIMGGAKMRKEAEKFPKYREAYIHAFDKCIVKRKADGLATDWTTGQQMYDWWVADRKGLKGNPYQTVLFE